MTIPRLSGWADELAPGLNALSRNVPRILNPNLDFQNAFQQEILTHPEIIQKYADMYANDPNALTKAGLNANQQKLVMSQPRSLASTEQKNTKDLITSDPSIARDASLHGLGLKTADESKLASTELTGKQLDNQIKQYGVDTQPLMQSILEGNVAQAQELVANHVKQVADRKLSDEVLAKIGGGANLYKAFSGKLTGVQLSADEQAAVIGQNKDLFEAQRQKANDEELTAYRESEARRNDAIANRQLRGPTTHDYVMQDIAGVAKIRAPQLLSALPLPPTIGIADVMQGLIEPSKNPEVIKYLQDAEAKVPVKALADAQKEWAASSKDRIKELNNFSKNNKMTDQQRSEIAQGLNEEAKRIFGGLTDASKIPVFGKQIEKVPGTFYGTNDVPVWGQLNAQSLNGLTPDLQKEVDRIVKMTTNDPDWEANLAKSGQPPEVIAAVKAAKGKK